MKIVFGSPPVDAVVNSEGPYKWIPLTKISPIKYYSAVVVVTIFLIGVSSGSLSYFSVFSYSQYAKNHAESIYYITLIGLFLVATLHELVHLSITPRFGLAIQSILGIWPKKLIFYTFYFGQLTKLRLMLIACAPLTLLTVLPIFISSILHWDSEKLGLLAIFNSMLSGIDVITLYLILSEVPKYGLCRQSGDNIYYSS